MRIWVINPNTTQTMTDTIAKCAAAVVGSEVTVTGVTSAIGPESIESYYDEALSVPGVLQAVQRGEREGVDGYVIACFGDPGLDAAREVAAGPVIGIAEAAMQAASHLGTGFSIVTTLTRTIGQSAHLAERYGMQRFCRGIHACEIPVLDLETDPDARKIITEACREAIENDRSDAVVLGCAGMADMCKEISAELGVPVVDGVTAATLTVQSLVTMGLRTSKRGEYATPPAKHYATGAG
ncbi:allantoin racemase [Mycolicibacterium sp. BK556]|nr:MULTISPECIES: aspartate/glutamate racemase family protein [unclassified Mycolicibacterium]MBB3601561.1 allantoin racemase [Mycolicibacterium sp. BK556]MBB3631313.1 allantoin racemase [Mycolicibacterium sp. BK607]MBB3749317.1 allantoin racemase [Mycolicibacterium sp. BK634]TDO14464.1 allantoin racemase [Mycobacterium sp. BK086]